MENIKIIVVFVEGVLSVFSPCVLPILPVYMSMLANSSIDDMGKCHKGRKRLIINTFLFVLGIASTFFILGASISAAAHFFDKYKSLIMVAGGAAVLIMGVFYLDIIKINFLMREKRFRYEYKVMSPLSAFLLGFFFSFGWTPCIGPIFASVIVLASSSENIYTANMLILLYTFGFILPFLIAAFFFNKLHSKLDFLKNHMNILKRVSGMIIVLAGAFLIAGGMQNIAENAEMRREDRKNEISEYEQGEKEYNEQKKNNTYIGGSSYSSEKAAPQFKLYDQRKVEHSLSDYKGKIVFLNFWATWCGPCRNEMPQVQELYNEYGENSNDVIILGISIPNLRGGDSKEDIIRYVSENGYDFPTLIDEEGKTAMDYKISAFPTTFIIGRSGNIASTIPGALEKEEMVRIVENALEKY